MMHNTERTAQSVAPSPIPKILTQATIVSASAAMMSTTIAKHPITPLIAIRLAISLTKVRRISEIHSSTFILVWFIRQYADGLVELGKYFRKARVGLLYDEGSKVFGLALLHPGSLHHVGITVLQVLNQRTTAAPAILFCNL